MRSRHLVAAIAAVLSIPVAGAPAAPATLPAVKRTLSAAGTSKAACHAGMRSTKGVAATTYRAPMAGFVDIRSNGTGDWDLAVYDAQRPARAIQGANGFDSREVVQTWATVGQRLVIQACHRSGRGTSLPVSITFTDAALPKSDMAPQMLRITVSRKQLPMLESTGVDVTHSVRVGSADAIVS